MIRPMCFDSDEQFKLWRSAAKIAHPGGSWVCSDCTPEYQAKMIKEYRCEKPLARFIREDGEMVGKAKWKE